MIEVEEYDVKNLRTYVAHQFKIRLAKKMGEKDVDPLFKLPRIPAEAVKDLAEELSQFELPAKTLDAELLDEFHFQYSDLFQSFVQSPGSAWSRGSSPEEIFDSHFQVGSMEDELLNEMLQDSPAENDLVMGSAANLIPEPEGPEDEGHDEPEEGEGG